MLLCGMGSGEWYRCGKKTTTEECRVLDVNGLARDGALRVGAMGLLSWTNLFTGERTASVGFSVRGIDDKRVLRFSYRWNDSEDVFVRIRLQTTRPNFGGRRWWFTCPSICKRRVRKLYLPPGRAEYGCRNCHDLTHYCRRHGYNSRSRMNLLLARETGMSIEEVRMKMSLLRKKSRKR